MYDDDDIADVVADQQFYTNRLLVIVIAFVVCFCGWAMSCDQPLKHVQHQLDAAMEEVIE